MTWKMLMLKRSALMLWMFVAVLPAPAQVKEQGTLISEVDMYVSPDSTSQKLATATRGRDVVLVMERTKMGAREWAHVLVVVDVDIERQSARQISGWIPSNVLITTGTPNGDQIIYGEAVDSENQEIGRAS